MTGPSDLLLGPFVDFGFMRRALVACLALALGGAPMGVLLVLRRMSLIGDAMGHAALPGVAVGFIIAGLSLPMMSLGGFVAGLVVALLSGLVTRFTALREDASFAAFYLISLSLGVVLVSSRGSNVDLIHVLFGSALAVDDTALLLVASIATVTMATLAVLYRPLVAECFDPEFLRAMGAPDTAYHLGFLVLMVLNMIAGFQALGTLMAVGLMMLPAASARFWAQQVWSMAAVATLFAALSGYVGLLLSFYFELPSGPAIVLTAGGGYALSVVFGRHDSLLRRLMRLQHVHA